MIAERVSAVDEEPKFSVPVCRIYRQKGGVIWVTDRMCTVG